MGSQERDNRNASMQTLHADTIDTIDTMQTIAPTGALSVADAIKVFVVELTAKNRARTTIATYLGDLTEWQAWLTTTNIAAGRVDQIGRADVTEYLAELGRRGVKGIT